MTGTPGRYPKETPSKEISPLMGGRSTASGDSVTDGSVDKRVRSLRIDARPCWKLLYCCTRS